MVDTRMRKHFGSSFFHASEDDCVTRQARRANVVTMADLKSDITRGKKTRDGKQRADTTNRILQIQRVGALFPLYRAATIGDKLHACSPGNTSLGRRTEPIPHCRCITGLYVRIYTPIDLRAPVHFE